MPTCFSIICVVMGDYLFQGFYYSFFRLFQDRFRLFPIGVRIIFTLGKSRVSIHVQRFGPWGRRYSSKAHCFLLSFAYSFFNRRRRTYRYLVIRIRGMICFLFQCSRHIPFHRQVSVRGNMVIFIFNSLVKECFTYSGT